jgi:ABC-type sugar transport system ATPase subunit
MHRGRARAVSVAAGWLFDESTAFLNHREVDIVLEAMRALKRQGLIVAFVSHHLAEAGVVADGLTILKDGRKVGDYAVHELSRDQIQSLMVGRDLSKGLFRLARRKRLPILSCGLTTSPISISRRARSRLAAERLSGSLV